MRSSPEPSAPASNAQRWTFADIERAHLAARKVNCRFSAEVAQLTARYAVVYAERGLAGLGIGGRAAELAVRTVELRAGQRRRAGDVRLARPVQPRDTLTISHDRAGRLVTSWVKSRVCWTYSRTGTDRSTFGASACR